MFLRQGLKKALPVDKMYLRLHVLFHLGDIGFLKYMVFTFGPTIQTKGKEKIPMTTTTFRRRVFYFTLFFFPKLFAA